MPAPPPRTPRFRITTRGLMLIGIYVAVMVEVVAVAVWAMTPLRDANQVGIALLLPAGLPVLGMFLSLMLKRPGPGRDAMLNVHAVVGVIGMIAIFAAPAALVVGAVIFHPEWLPMIRQVAAQHKKPGLDFLMTVFAPIVFTACFAPAIAAKRPRKCPSCGWWCLIRSFQTQRDTANPLLYYWCVACGARCKTPRPEAIPWEDASEADDNRWYDLGRRKNRESRAAAKAAGAAGAVTNPPSAIDLQAGEPLP